MLNKIRAKDFSKPEEIEKAVKIKDEESKKMEEDYSRILFENDSLKSQCQLLKNENESLKTNLIPESTKAKLEMENQNLQEKINVLSEKMENIKEDLRDFSYENSELKEKNENLEEDISSLENDVAMYSDEVDLLKEETEELTKIIVSYKTRFIQQEFIFCYPQISVEILK